MVVATAVDVVAPWIAPVTLGLLASMNRPRRGRRRGHVAKTKWPLDVPMRLCYLLPALYLSLHLTKFSAEAHCLGKEA